MKLFNLEKRDNGTEFYTTDNEAIRDWVRHCHNGKLPSDYIYKLCKELSDDIASELDNNEYAEASEINLENYYIYYNDVIQWFKECDGWEWVDNMHDEYGELSFKDGMMSIMTQAFDFYLRDCVANFPIEVLKDSKVQV